MWRPAIAVLKNNRLLWQMALKFYGLDGGETRCLPLNTPTSLEISHRHFWHSTGRRIGFLLGTRQRRALALVIAGVRSSLITIVISFSCFFVLLPNSWINSLNSENPGTKPDSFCAEGVTSWLELNCDDGNKFSSVALQNVSIAQSHFPLNYWCCCLHTLHVGNSGEHSTGTESVLSELLEFLVVTDLFIFLAWFLWDTIICWGNDMSWPKEYIIINCDWKGFTLLLIVSVRS